MYSAKGIGILPGNNLSYIDHLVPLCQIMEVPLLVTDPWVKELIELYYPPMPLLLAQPEDYNLDPYLEGYDLFYYVDFFRKANGTFKFKEYYCSKKARSVISLHGNPDKFLDIYWLEHLNDEDIVLVYGDQLQETLMKKGITKDTIRCGNYRLEFYQKHASFFDAKVPFEKKKTTVLYAPTWSAPARFSIFRREFSPFFEIYEQVFREYSETYQLIVKLHPHMRVRMPQEVEEVVQAHPHICFLNDFPPIYPLLMQIDIYLGDYSSIGYDFLYFERPLHFLGTDKQTPLQKHQDGRGLYAHVFGERKELHTLKQEIEDACRSDSPGA